MLKQDAGWPRQVLSAPPLPSQASPSRLRRASLSTKMVCAIFQGRNANNEDKKGPFSSRFHVGLCFKYYICINSLIFPTTHEVGAIVSPFFRLSKENNLPKLVHGKRTPKDMCLSTMLYQKCFVLMAVLPAPWYAM